MEELMKNYERDSTVKTKKAPIPSQEDLGKYGKNM
jgi:hypothetical protein